MDPESDSGKLARGLFEYQHESARARVLLLSATPYKMYTLAHEAEEDHYRDFVETLRFLMEGDTDRVKELLRDYRDQLLRMQDDGGSVAAARVALEAELQRVMIRTERLAASEDRDGMLREVVPDGGSRLEARDLRTYVDVQRLADWLEHPDATEYWKASPYLLSFMETYKFKGDLKRWLQDPDWSLEGQRLLRQGQGLGLPWDLVERYADLDPANPRLRALLAETIERGAWRLLWIPPSIPYYEPGGAYADPVLKGFTKRLVFGSWVVVPKMLTCLLSYEAERRMIRSLEESPENTPESRARRRPLLMFTRTEGRLTGMPVLGMLYPSSTLARIADPLALTDPEDGLVTGQEMLGRVQAMIEEEIQAIAAGASAGGPEDESWYWAAPILLDIRRDRAGTLAWFSQRGLAALWTGGRPDEEEESRWTDHVLEAQELAFERSVLGRPPADLSRVLAQMAVAGPATSVLRALCRVSGGLAVAHELWARNAAASVGWSFRSLFNLPEVMALIRGANRVEPYWRRVVEHCVDGNLQAALDEYAHILREALGLQTRPRQEVAREVAAAMARALSLRTPTLRVDELQTSGRVRFEQRGMRGRFALRFQSEESETGGAATRPEQVREAFNSPFWPFVLATTSVGQEGLDFHQYCHAVVHWNLPSNPVDLEQREGRVHRYKGHAVRKNVASAFRDAALSLDGADPWDGLFDAAYDSRPPGSSDIVPFWVFAQADGARIERHVPFLPLSHDRQRLEALRRSLAVYRMVFGQPRQEDLLAYLTSRLPQGRIDALLREARIDLSPPASRRPSP
ncbi:MAG: C-terminal helicase domain-containing protein [Actinomycetota bacterium]